MADIQSNISVNIDTSNALANLKALQGQISAFHQQMAKSGALAASEMSKMQNNLMNGLNRSGQFDARLKTIKSTTESFTEALEKNKLSMGQYFKYAGAATKDFGRLFGREFDTIEKVARERVKDLQTQYIKMGRDANGAMKAIAIRPLVLDLDNASTKMQIAAQKQQILNQLLKQGSTQMLNWGKNTQWAGRQLMVGFTVPLTMLGQIAGKTFMDMEQAVIKFQRVYGDFNTTTQQTKAMTTEITNLAKSYTKYGVAVSDTMNMAADAAAMGKQGAELTAQVQSATNLAVLGGIDQKQALETTISLTNAFGISADQLTSKINFLNVVENQTVTSIDDLTVAIPKAAPVIKQLGGNVEDLAFFLTAMKEGGINASEGANALKSGIASIINPTKKASDMLAGFGINIKGIVENNKGDVRGMVMGVAEALNQLDPLKRAQAIEQLFGKFQFARISTLFKNITDVNSQASKVAALAAQGPEASAILAQREMKKIEESPMFKFKKALEDLKVQLIPLGEQFLKMVTPIAEFVNKALEGFNNLSSGTKDTIGQIALWLGGFGPILIMTIGLIANGIANMIKVFATIKAFLNGVGKSTHDLGSQTSYMTQQQIEAAAVASSLDQVHAKLRQTFTAEAGAVANLTAQLEKAVAAQAAFGAVSGGRGGAPKARRKMATGGMVVGPGGPKDDLVPTDLSNGEAVIDAETVKKNPRIIGALFAGKKINIPGYAKNNSDDIKPKVYSAKAGGIRVSVKDQLVKEFGEQEAAQRLAAVMKRRVILEEEMLKLGTMTEKQMKEALNVVRGHTQTGLDKSKRETWHPDKWTPGLSAENTGVMNALTHGKYLEDGTRQLSKNGELYLEELKLLEGQGVTRKQIATIEEKVRKNIALTDDELSIQGRVLRNIADKSEKNAEYAKRSNKNFQQYARVVGNTQLRVEQGGARTQSSGASRGRIVQSGNQYFAIDPTTGKKTRVSNAEGEAAAAEQEKRDKINARRRELRAAKKAGIAAPPIESATAKPSMGKRIMGGVKNFGGKIMGGGVGAGMGLGMAGAAIGMIPGMEGVGTAVSMAGMIPTLLPLLANPIGATVAALGALTLGVIALNAANEENKKKQIALGNASVMSADKMIQVSKDLGTVTATEARRGKQSADIAGISTKDMGAAESYLQTKSGKAMLADLKTQKDAGKTDTQIADATVNNLANLVSQGAMSKEIASGVLTALGQQTGNFGLTASSSKLQSLTSGNTTGIGAATLQNVQQNYGGIQEQKVSTYRGSFSNLAVIMPKLREGAIATSNAYSQIVGQADVLNQKLKGNKITQEEYNKEIAINKKQQEEAFAAANKIKDTMGSSEWSDTFAKNIKETFGENSEAAKTADKINALKDSDFKTRMQMNLESGALTPDVVNKFLEMQSSDAAFEKTYNASVSVNGQTATDDLVINMLLAGQTQTQIDAVLSVTAKDPEMFKNVQNILSTANKLNIDVSGVDLSDVNVVKQLSTEYSKIDTMTKKGPITMETVIKQDGNFAGLKGQAAWFNKLPAASQKFFLTYYATVQAKMNDSDVRNWLAKKQGMGALIGTQAGSGIIGGLKVTDADRNAYAASVSQDATKAFTAANSVSPGGNTPTGGGGTTASDRASAALSILGRKEEAINKTYDKRLKALDEIQAANEKINQQKKDQMDLADALSRGDIGAAARAQQQARENAQSAALQEQRDKMNAAKDAQIAGLSVNGMTRAQIEAWQAKQSNKADVGTLANWHFATGGMVPKTQYFAIGGKPRGTDTISAMLSPGEFVVRKRAVDALGAGTMNKINKGQMPSGGSVYNYSISVNVKSDADPDQIAKTVIAQIERTENQAMKGNKA